MLDETKGTSPVLDSVLRLLEDVQTDLSDAESVSRAGIMTAAEYSAMSVQDRNRRVIDAVRDRCREGSFAGWQCLANIASAVALPARLVADVVTSLGVYDNLRPAVENDKAGLRMVITHGDRDSIHHVAPKNIGGAAWKHSAEYTPAAQRVWANTEFAPMSPCVSFIWLGPQRKTIARADLDACNALSLLGTVDYDFDRREVYDPGFAHAVALAKDHVTKMGTKMQGTALAALLTFDAQQYVRRVHESWVEGGKGAANSGPRAVSPEDWIAAIVGDCGALCAFGYEDAADYLESRSTMFAAMVMACTHDVLYDRATSNMMSSVMYMDGAGVAKYDVHTAFLTTVVDQTARRILAASSIAVPLYGDNSLLAGAAWAPFNMRYRAWERFVKYTRQLRVAGDNEVLSMAKRSLVLPEGSVTEMWRAATTPGVQDTLIQRSTVAYTPSSAPDIAALPPPHLCDACRPSFGEALQASATDTIHGIAGLPATVIAAPAVSRAAAIRRAALFGSSADCCDVCASRIGCWADHAGYTVLTALMRSDESTSAAEWLLECYTVWTVTTSPVSIATVLSGFDLRCDMHHHEGAMGVRDVLDC